MRTLAHAWRALKERGAAAATGVVDDVTRPARGVRAEGTLPTELSERTRTCFGVEKRREVRGVTGDVMRVSGMTELLESEEESATEGAAAGGVTRVGGAEPCEYSVA